MRYTNKIETLKSNEEWKIVVASKAFRSKCCKLKNGIDVRLRISGTQSVVANLEHMKIDEKRISRLIK